MGFLIWAIGVSFGGPTEQMLSIQQETWDLELLTSYYQLQERGKSDWAYSWVPVVGPIIGGLTRGFCIQIGVHGLKTIGKPKI